MKDNIKLSGVVLKVSGLFDLTKTPVVPFTALENPTITHILKFEDTELPIYNNFFIFPIKGYYIPLYLIFFKKSPDISWYLGEQSKQLRGSYIEYITTIKQKFFPKIKQVVMFTQDNKVDLTTFNILIWGNLLTKTPTKVMARAFKGTSYELLWRKIAKDYPYLMRLGSIAVYPLRYNLMKVQDLNTINLFLQTRRSHAPVINIPDYPLGLPFIPPEEVRQFTSTRFWDAFELNVRVLINDNEEDIKKRRFVPSHYSSAIQLHDSLVFSTVNPYTMEIKQIKVDGQELVLKRIRGKYYTKPIVIHKLISDEIWPSLKEIMRKEKNIGQFNYYSIERSGNFYFPVLNVKLISVNKNGWVLFQLGEGGFTVAPADSISVEKVFWKTSEGKWYAETLPVMKLGKMKILIKDPNTSKLSYMAIGNFFRKIKKQK